MSRERRAASLRITRASNLAMGGLRRSAVATAAALVCACSGSSERGGRTGDHGVVTIDSSADVVVGGDSAALYQVSSGLFLGDSVLLAERSTSSLRLYGPDGHFVRSVGSQGSGPGDFAFLLWVQSSGDRLYAYDAAQRRLSAFARDLTFLHSTTLRIPSRFGSAYAIGVFTDQSILIGAHQPRATIRHPSVIRTKVVLLRADSAMSQLDSLGVAWDQELFVTPFGRSGESISPLVFGRQGSVAVGQTDYFVSEDDSAVVERRTLNGTLASLLRPRFDPSRRKVTSADVGIARRRFVEPKSPAVSLGDIFDAMPVPDSFPPFGWSGKYPMRPLRVHGDGTVWLLHFGGVTDLAPTWTIFGSDGSVHERVRSSTPMEVLDSQGDRLLILRHGDAGEEIVEIRHLSGL